MVGVVNTHNTSFFQLHKMNTSRKAYTSSRRDNQAWIKRIEKEIKEYSKYSWYDRTLHDKCIEHCQKEIDTIDQELFLASF